MQRYLRVFYFAQQLLALGLKNPLLLAPLLANIVLAAPLNLMLSVVLAWVDSELVYYGVLTLGVAGLYFIDYFAGGVTVALFRAELAQERTNLEQALQRTYRVAGPIAQLAAIASLLELANALASERGDLVSRAALRVIHWTWTTASYAILPVLMIEGGSFRSAFSRARELGAQDPTQAGIGIVAVGAVNYLFGIATFSSAYSLLTWLEDARPVLANLVFYSLINLYFALAGYLKVTYATSFYLWSRECQKTSTSAPILAPRPLAVALMR